MKTGLCDGVGVEVKGHFGVGVKPWVGVEVTTQ